MFWTVVGHNDRPNKFLLSQVLIYPASGGLSLAWLLAFTKALAFLMG